MDGGLGEREGGRERERERGGGKRGHVSGRKSKIYALCSATLPPLLQSQNLTSLAAIHQFLFTAKLKSMTCTETGCLFIFDLNPNLHTERGWG